MTGKFEKDTSLVELGCHFAEVLLGLFAGFLGDVVLMDAH